MKTLLSMLIALVMALTMSHPVLVTEAENDNRSSGVQVAAVPFTSGEESATGDETVALEPDPLVSPPGCEPAPIADEDTEPEETIALESDPLVSPPGCEPAPIADEDTEPEETVALEPDPLVGPPLADSAEQ